MMGGCGAAIFCALAVDRPHRKKTSEIKEIRSFTDICSNELDPKTRIVAPVEQKVMSADQQGHRQFVLTARLDAVCDRSGGNGSGEKSRTTTKEQVRLPPGLGQTAIDQFLSGEVPELCECVQVVPVDPDFGGISVCHTQNAQKWYLNFSCHWPGTARMDRFVCRSV
jgi:hypothetical protein